MSILTGQYVRIAQTAASIGDRILAQLVDWCIMLAYVLFMAWLGATAHIDGFWYYVLLIFLPFCFYTLLCEIFNHGQSLGKMVLKTRVVKADGSTPSLGAFILRWLIYIVDGPMLSFVGLIPMALTKNNQRLGDLAAGTVVIKLQGYKKIQVSLDDYDYLTKDYTPRYPQAADLSLEQIEIITRALANAHSDLGSHLPQLAQKVQEKMHVERAEKSDEAFLQRIVRDYQYYALEEI